ITILILAMPWQATAGPKSKEVTVVDATGAVVGEFVGVSSTLGSVQVALRIDDQVFLVEIVRPLIPGAVEFFSVSKSGPPLFHGFLLFESTDCSGTPFVTLGFSILPVIAVGSPGQTVYLGDETATPQTRTVRSTLQQTCGTFGFFP